MNSVCLLTKSENDEFTIKTRNVKLLSSYLLLRNELKIHVSGGHISPHKKSQEDCLLLDTTIYASTGGHAQPRLDRGFIILTFGKQANRIHLCCSQDENSKTTLNYDF